VVTKGVSKFIRDDNNIFSKEKLLRIYNNNYFDMHDDAQVYSYSVPTQLSVSIGGLRSHSSFWGLRSAA
jgi:hypothetical protein